MSTYSDKVRFMVSQANNVFRKDIFVLSGPWRIETVIS